MKPQRFEADIEMGHKGAAVIVPFDPAVVWGTPAVAIREAPASFGKRTGHLVRGTINGHRFEGFIGYRWKRFFILVGEDLQQAAGVSVGDRVEMVVRPRATR